MSGRAWGNEYRTTSVCVDGYDNCAMSGRLYNPYIEEGERFESLVDFLLKMERLLDAMKLPQPFMAARRFSAPPAQGTGDATGAEQERGKLATFAVRILFRQNAAWQGSVTWLEEQREESFRSVLELILLMHSALTGDVEEQELSSPP